jgi:hypothetical protein
VPSRKTGSKTINAAYIKKALTKSQVIFKQKKAGIVVPGLVSVLGQVTKSTLPPLSKRP